MSEEPYIDTLTVLRTVDVRIKEQEKTLIDQMILASNDKLQVNDKKMEELNKSKEKFALQTIIIEEKIKKIEALKNNLLDNLNRSKVFSCKKIISNVNSEKEQINTIKLNINEETLKFINPINDFLDKKYKYDKISSQIFKKINIWLGEINNDVFRKNIEDKINKIDEYLGVAEKNVNYNDSEVIRSFTLFKKNLFSLLVFDNYYEKFKYVLFKKTEELSSRMKEYIDLLEKQIETNLSYLNIDLFFKNIEEEISQAKESFYNLDIENTKFYIEKYSRSLLGLFHTVSTELRAFNFFSTNGIHQIKKYFSSIDDKFSELKKSFENLLHIDKMFYWSLETQINEIDNLLKEITESIKVYTNDMENPNISYTTKQNKYKKIFILMETFIDLCNEVDKMIDSFYTEGVSQGLKYNKLKKIYISGLSDIKRFNIKLSIEDKETIDLIEKLKQKIEQNIFQEENYNENFLKKDVDEFFNLIVLFVNTIMKKIAIIKAFSVLNIEYSYKRIDNNLYDMKVIESENLIHEGKYFEGLNFLVQSIKEVK